MQNIQHKYYIDFIYSIMAFLKHKKFINGVKGVCIYVFSYWYFKLCLFIFKTCETVRQTAGKFRCRHRMQFSENVQRLAFGACSWCSTLLLILCAEEAVWKLCGLFTIKFINENIHWYGTGKMSNSLNRLYRSYSFCNNHNSDNCLQSKYLSKVGQITRKMFPHIIIEKK